MLHLGKRAAEQVLHRCRRLLTLGTLLVVLDPAGALATELDVESVEVDRQLIRPGEVVRVQVRVRNVGEAIVREVTLVPAVTTRGIPWQPVDVGGAGPVAELLPGAEIELEARVRLDASGSVRVGGFVIAREGFSSLPQGQLVRVGSVLGLVGQVAALFGMFAALAVTLASVTFAAKHSRSLRVWPPALVAAAALAAAGVAMWAVGEVHSRDQAIAGSTLLAAGWVSGATGIFRTRWPLAVPIAAAAVYVALGLAWVLIFVVAIRGFTVGEIPAMLRVESIVYWPFEVAQASGAV